MNWLALAPMALSTISSLTAKKKAAAAPQYQAPAQYQGAQYQAPPDFLNAPQYQFPQYQAAQYQAAPAVPNFGQQLPAYASMLQQAGDVYDSGQGAPYQQMLSQFQSGKLPPELRAQVLGQAQLEAQNAYKTANQDLTFDEDRAMRSASERMNKMGLLSSGAHGVAQGQIGEGYARQRGTLAANMQSQMGAASTNLMQQEFDQRDRMAQLLSGLEQSRQSTSLGSRNALLSAFGQERGLQAGLAERQYGYQQANSQFGNSFRQQEAQNQNAYQQRGAEFGYSAQQTNVNNFNNYQQQAAQNRNAYFQDDAQFGYGQQVTNAQNQFASQKFGYEQQGAANASLFENAGSLVSEYGRQRTLRRSGDRSGSMAAGAALVGRRVSR